MSVNNPVTPAENKPAQAPAEPASSAPESSGDSAALDPSTSSQDQPSASAKADRVLTTETLQERIREQLSGAKSKPAGKSGQESSPDSPADTTPESSTDPDGKPEPTADDKTNGHGKRHDPKIAALAKQREERRELKSQLEAKDAELKTTQTRLDELEAQLAKLSGEKPTAAKTPPSPTTDANQPPELLEAKEKVTGLSNAVDWLNKQQKLIRRDDVDKVIENLNKLNIAVDDTSPDGLRDWLDDELVQYQTQLQQAMVDARVMEVTTKDRSRMETEALKRHAEEMASQWAPEIDDPGSQRGKVAEEMRKLFPEINSNPRAKAFIAAAVRGFELLNTTAAEATPAPKAKTTAAPPKTRLPGAPSALSVRPADGVQSSSSLLKKYQQSGDLADKQAWMKAVVAGR